MDQFKQIFLLLFITVLVLSTAVEVEYEIEVEDDLQSVLLTISSVQVELEHLLQVHTATVDC